MAPEEKDSQRLVLTNALLRIRGVLSFESIPFGLEEYRAIRIDLRN